jgi:hypothetical protein
MSFQMLEPFDMNADTISYFFPTSTEMFFVNVIQARHRRMMACQYANVRQPIKWSFKTATLTLSLLLLPDVYRDVFRECHTGSSSEDDGLSICQCTPAYQVVFEDGDSIEVRFPRKDEEAMSRPVEILSRARMNSFEIGEAEKSDEYFHHLRSPSAPYLLTI